MLTNEEKLKIAKRFFTKVGRGDFSVIKQRTWGLSANFADYCFREGFRARLDFSFFETWREYSGNFGYPIKSPNEEFDAEEYYYLRADLYSGEYGHRRMKLARFIARNIEKAVVFPRG